MSITSLNAVENVCFLVCNTILYQIMEVRHVISQIVLNYFSLAYQFKKSSSMLTDFQIKTFV